MAKLRLKNLTKVFPDGKKLFENLSVTVGQEDFLVIIGPSGCGKTTLLRIIAGLEQPTSGEIWIDDADAGQFTPQERKVGMVFQDYALYPHMTVFGNLSFALEIQKKKKKERQSRVSQTAEKLGISEHLKKYPVQLSGGERQRTAIGRALAADCDIYLCDEPLSNLHPELRAEIRGELLRLHKEQKKPIIFVTHDQTDVMTLATKAIVLKDGEIQQAASPDELYSRPANCFVAGFFGTPPMNFLEAEIIREAGRTYFRVGSEKTEISGEKWLETYPESKVIVGIRPENILSGGVPGEEKEICQISGKVCSYENLGSCLWITILAGGQKIKFIDYGTLRTSVEKEIILKADRNTLHFFHIQTQKRLN